MAAFPFKLWQGTHAFFGSKMENVGDNTDGEVPSVEYVPESASTDITWIMEQIEDIFRIHDSAVAQFRELRETSRKIIEKIDEQMEKGRKIIDACAAQRAMSMATYDALFKSNPGLKFNEPDKNNEDK